MQGVEGVQLANLCKMLSAVPGINMLHKKGDFISTILVTKRTLRHQSKDTEEVSN